MVGILYCRKSSPAYEKIETLLRENGIPARSVAIEDVDRHSLEPFSVLINAMDSFYPDEHLDVLTNAFQEGKKFIHLCATPFTRSLSNGCMNIRALRSFGIIDDFRPIEGQCSYVITADGTRADIALTGLYSAVYRLCEQDPDGANRRTARLEHLLDAYDEKDTLLAVPVIRVVTHAQGSMTFFSFDFDVDMLQAPFWRSLFLTVVKKELFGTILLSVDCSFARYLPDETKNITIKADQINLRSDGLSACQHHGAGPKTGLTLTVSVYDHEESAVFQHTEPLALPCEEVFSLNISASSLYRVTVMVSMADIVLSREETGFLVLSDEELRERFHLFRPMYIDESISTDHCLVDGRVTAILGTTYFVTDVYQNCFYDMNAWLCAKEMEQLHRIGFNVLRSGNWTYIPDFYQTDGSLGERAVRALQTYFLLAAENGFTVQFALGNVMLNQWDAERSAIHDLMMREKCMNLVRSFAEHFRDCPNVVLDIVNEPSYSRKGAWSTARPSGEPGELARYRTWLADKYHGDISLLREAWGETSATIPDFATIRMPDSSLFLRGMARTEQRINHAALTDFYAFARNEFLDWTAEVRTTVKAVAPGMPVIMGRDETLRIPAQQDEICAGNIDMVCWHQWHHNSDILYEYLLNRVRGRVCVAQELGMYKYDDIRGGKRHSEEEMAAKLEKKLLYGFGNFVQWQAFDNPFMYELSENSLGLYHADRSPTPSLAATRKLIAAEKEMQPFLYGRQDDKVRIATVYNSSYYFSADHPIAQQGIRNHIYALYYCLKEQADFLPEQLMRKQHASAIGEPRLIVLPAMQTLSRSAWDELLEHARNGCVLLVSGCIDQNEYFAPDAKIAGLDPRYTTRKLMNFEKITLDGREYVLDFRRAVDYTDVSNTLNCGQINDRNATAGITEYAVGAGKLLYCPYPLELSSNTDAVCACYRYAIERAQAHNRIYRIIDAGPNVVFTAVSYQNCTVYTLLNEGFADTVCWIDLRSGKKLTVNLGADRGCKLWLDTGGGLLEVFGDVEVEVSEQKRI